MDNLDNEVIHKAGSVSFQSGSNTLNYSYTPNENAKSTSTIAYEYCFGSTMDTTMAVNLKSIDTTNVTVRYAYSPTKLTSSDTFTSDEEYTIQKLTSRGSKVYIYLLVTPTDEKIPTTFTTSIVFCYGKLQVMTYTANGETKTKEIVKGQSIELFEDPVPTEEGYYFDAWYKDSEYKYLANEMDITQASKPLYARFANLPSDWMALDSINDEYYINRGSSSLPKNLIIPNYYNDKPVTYIADGTSIQTSVFYGNSVYTVSFSSIIESIGEYAFANQTQLLNIDFTSCTKLNTIKHAAFHFCRAINKIVLPKCLKIIENAGFGFCRSLTQITICGNVDLGYDAFGGCTALAEIYNLTSRQFTLGTGANDNGGITRYAYVVHTSLSEQSKVVDLNGVYYYVKNSDEYIALALNQSVNHFSTIQGLRLDSRTIEMRPCFIYVSGSINTVDLSNCTKLKIIEDGAFRQCNHLTTVILPNSIIKIGNIFVESCPITTLTLPSGNWYRTNNKTDWENMENGELVALGTDSEIATNFTTSSEYYNYYWYKV